MDKINLKDWKDITLKQFYQIQDLLDEPDEYTTFNMLDLIYDIDSASMTLQELSKYNSALDFIGKDVPVVNLKNQYEINGTVYNSNYNLTTVTASQFVDYQNYTKENKWENFLSVFFIPVGHTYNDGYDMKKVKEDMLQLDFATVNSIGFFFILQFEAFSKHFLSSLKKTVKKMDIPTEKKKEIIDQLNKADLTNLESFLLY